MGHPRAWPAGATLSRRQFVAAGAAGAASFAVPLNIARPAVLRDSVVVRWNDALLHAIRGSRVGPPMVARALAIAHTCMYDAWAAYDHKAVGTRLGGLLRRPPRERTLANVKRTVSFAAYRAAIDLFPGSLSIFGALMHDLGYDGGDRSTDTSTATGIGNVAAQAVLDLHHRDGANQLGDEPGGARGVPYADYTGYVPANEPMDIRVPFDPSTVHDPSSWQPLRYVDAGGGVVTPGFVGAHWQRVKTFAVSPGSLRSSTGPARYGSPEYLAQAQALLEISAALTDEQKLIAEYWADGPRSELPPGHWSLLAQFVSRREALLCAHECGVGRGLLRLGQQAGLRLGPSDHRDPDASPWPARARLGRAVPGDEAHRRRDVVSIPADDFPDATIPGVLVRPQQFQRGERRGPEALYGQ
jgi:hypothetical protein